MDEQKVREAIERIRGMRNKYKAVLGSLPESARRKSDYNNDVTAFETAIEALEKQLPKKLIERHYEEEGEEPYIKMTCPNGCSFQLSRSSKYCRDCGQKLDWSE